MFLDSPQRCDGFLQFFGDVRICRTAIFQVMHHGSRKNWQPDFAEKISPAASLFSSDPGHKRFRHPHAPVLRDFWPYHPVQIDRQSAFHLVADLMVQSGR